MASDVDGADEATAGAGAPKDQILPIPAYRIGHVENEKGVTGINTWQFLLRHP